MATSDQGKQGGQGGKQQGSTQGSKQSDTSKRGFASMDPAQQREIASEGGRAAHEKGTAHEFTSEEARRAGSMSHKNDSSSQSSSPSTASRSGGAGGNQGSARDEDQDEDDMERGKPGSGGRPGGGSKS